MLVLRISFKKFKYQSLLTKITFIFIEESSNNNKYSCNHKTINIDHNNNRALTMQNSIWLCYFSYGSALQVCSDAGGKRLVLFYFSNQGTFWSFKVFQNGL